MDSDNSLTQKHQPEEILPYFQRNISERLCKPSNLVCFLYMKKANWTDKLENFQKNQRRSQGPRKHLRWRPA